MLEVWLERIFWMMAVFLAMLGFDIVLLAYQIHLLKRQLKKLTS